MRGCYREALGLCTMRVGYPCSLFRNCYGVETQSKHLNIISPKVWYTSIQVHSAHLRSCPPPPVQPQQHKQQPQNRRSSLNPLHPMLDRLLNYQPDIFHYPLETTSYPHQ